MRRIFYFFTNIYNATFLYATPSNLSYNWNYGSLALFCLILQIITGLCLACWYVPHIDFAFITVDFIMREVSNGWLLRYSHANGASLFFLIIYLHIARSLFYNSLQTPRIFVWLSGLVIYFVMIITAFLGYVLPWGQMSFWAATVITSLVSIIPFFGESCMMLIWGGFGIGQQTLTRFYRFHFLLPFVLVFITIIHLLFLHVPGSSDPIIDSKFGNDKIAFHPYYVYKDIVGIFFILSIFFTFTFFFPNLLGHPLNYIPANPGVTPVHIVPEWYFLPFYGILRAIPSKIFGVLLMATSLLLLVILPFIYTTEIKQVNYRPISKLIIFFFFGTFILLGWVGAHVLESPFIELSQLFCVFYLMFFPLLYCLNFVERAIVI